MYRNKLDVLVILTFFDKVVETQFKASGETAMFFIILDSKSKRQLWIVCRVYEAFLFMWSRSPKPCRLLGGDLLVLLSYSLFIYMNG